MKQYLPMRFLCSLLAAIFLLGGGISLILLDPYYYAVFAFLLVVGGIWAMSEAFFASRNMHYSSYVRHTKFRKTKNSCP